MKLPWVSRERFEELQQRCQSLDAERTELLRVVLRGGMRSPAPVEDDGVVPFREAPKGTDSRPPVSNPFDHIEGRFEQALREKRVSARFRAR